VVGSVPLQPPEAVQATALAAFHCSVTDEPMTTLVSLAFNVTDGGGTTVLFPGGVLVAGGGVLVAGGVLVTGAPSVPAASTDSVCAE
jgi:hypothetical protein